MRLSATMLALVGTTAGAAAAVAAYQAGAGPAPDQVAAGNREPATSSIASTLPPSTVAPVVHTRWKKCAKGTHLRHGTCVRVVHRVVVVQDPPAPVAPAQSSPVVPVTPPVVRGTPGRVWTNASRPRPGRPSSRPVTPPRHTESSDEHESEHGDEHESPEPPEPPETHSPEHDD